VELKQSAFPPRDVLFDSEPNVWPAFGIRTCGWPIIRRMLKKTDFRTMVPALSFEELNVGERWLSPGRTVTAADIVNFACQTGDFNSLHVDAEFAAGTVYRQPIAHGLMGLSWAAGLGSNFPRVSTLSFAAIRDWEFLRPVYVGDTLHAETEVLDKRPTGRRSGKVAWLIRVFNQKQELVQQGVFETLVATKLREGRITPRPEKVEPRETVTGSEPSTPLP
jgi:3-hydroxybutyryl-CoA dehydratase